MSASELVPMKFDQYFSIKLGLPQNELPTFAYRIMNEFGVYDDEQYGSIHANFPVSAYAPDVLADHLQHWIAQQLEIEKRFVRVEVLLGKPVLVESVLEYIHGYMDTLVIATGVQLCCEGHVGLYTVSRRHRPTADSDISKFAGDIHRLRKMNDDTYYPSAVAASEKSGEVQSMSDLVAKWKHMFVMPKPNVPKHSLMGYYLHVMAWSNFDTHIRSVIHKKNSLEITLGNCWITFEQREKTLKATFHTNVNETGIGDVRHYSAQSPKTIDAGLADVLAVERFGYQTHLGHYSRDNRTQYDYTKLLKWFKAQAKKLGRTVLDYSSGDDHVYEIMWPSGTHVLARLIIRFVHAEIEIDVGDDKWNRFHLYHNTCEQESMNAAEMHMQDSIRRELSGE